MTDEPFGRQPKSVTVSITGEWEDMVYWARHLKRAAEFKGDDIQTISEATFTIHPRAVND